ncbi:hypothetical protein CRM90_22495 [Mycobacterium sp. ENV421]|uniref:hypothetical protein n=1 Tax=Mycobacterium sp. ENV421 TaxID=1213407 RepID=UPI000C9B1F5E|nr:hypothetical protein [Mycobacterium sp. ENV421]PND55523.1 hypothetical protein CRM90_22495 [Mycobacterium sp. ENV421]
MLTTDHYVELTPNQREAQMRACQLRDTRRRIEGLLREYTPTEELALDEAQFMLAALSAIVRTRDGSVAGARVALTLNGPAGCTADWEIGAK